MTFTLAKNIFICVLLFLGFSAIGGGGALIVSPSGELLGGLPLSMLDGSPFSDFFIPGIILLFVMGLSPCFLVVILAKMPKNRLIEKSNFYLEM